MIFGIEKAKMLVACLTEDECSSGASEDVWTYTLVPMPCGTKAKIEVRDGEGFFVAYMGEDLTTYATPA